MALQLSPRHGIVAIGACAALLFASACSPHVRSADEPTGREHSVAGPSEPGPSEPMLSEPAPSEPAPSEPVPSEPVLSEPVLSVAEPAETPMTEPGTQDAAHITTCTFDDWDTSAKDVTYAYGGVVSGVDARTDPCFDEITIHVDAARAEFPGYHVSYVPEAVEDGSGASIPLRGTGVLQVIVDAPAYDGSTGELAMTMSDRHELVDTAGFGAVQQVAFAGSFEGVTTVDLGVTGQRPFDVTAGIVVGGGGFVTIRVLR